MKRFQMILCLLAVLVLVSGCAPAEPRPSGSQSATAATAPGASATMPTQPPEAFLFPYADDEELTMAYEAGFVPEALWSAMEKTVTLAEFTGMVRTVVAEADPGATAAFDEYMGTAGTIAQPTDRSLAAIVLYYGTHVLEIPEHTWFSLRQSSDCWATGAMGLNDFMGDRWGEFQHLYCAEGYEGTFPHVYEGGYACEGFWDGSVDVAAYFSMLNRSTYDGRMYFDYDFEENTMHMDYTVSVEAGIRAVTRFYVMCHQEALFMSSMQERLANTPHKQPIEDYNIHDFVDGITVGIHYNHGQTDWRDMQGAVHIQGDGFYEKMLSSWEVLTGRDNQKAVIKAYKEMGFDTVRMPVTWTPYMDPVTDEIDEGFLDYVEYQVNLLLDEGFRVIMNSMGDYASADGACVDGVLVGNWMEPEYAESVNDRYRTMWLQIAERFKDYDEDLVFESLNEPQQSIFPEYSTGDYAYQGDRINELNQIFVDVVRSTGGNNEKRALMIVPLWGQFFMDTLVPPMDDHIFASYHTYFSNNGAIGFYDLSADEAATDEAGDFLHWSQEDTVLQSWVDKTYEQIRVFKETYGIPVVIGEFSPSMKVPEEDRIFMTQYVMNKAQSLNCPVIFWDGYFGGEGDVGFYLLGKDEWRSPALFEALMELAAQRQ